MKELLLLLPLMVFGHWNEGGWPNRRDQDEGGFRFLPPPGFLLGVNASVRMEWFSIPQMRETIAQQQQAQLDFGAKYALTANVTEWLTNISNWENQLEANISAIISNLSAAQSQMSAIYRNQNQTWMQMMEAIRNFTRENPAGEALLCISRSVVRASGGPGGQGGFGGQNGFSGFGGQQNGPVPFGNQNLVAGSNFPAFPSNPAPPFGNPPPGALNSGFETGFQTQFQGK